MIIFNPDLSVLVYFGGMGVGEVAPATPIIRGRSKNVRWFFSLGDQGDHTLLLFNRNQGAMGEGCKRGHTLISRIGVVVIASHY